MSILGRLNPNSNQRLIVYDSNDISPTLQAAMGEGGGQIPMIVEDFFSCAMRGRYDDNGNINQHLEINNNITSNCITNVGKDSLVMEEYKVNKIGSVYNDGSECGAVVKDDGLASTVVAGTHGYANTHIAESKKRYRIRKLTPKETWRLQGIDDQDYEKAANVNSATQLYKESGNSICINVLTAIFGQMFEGHEDDYKKIADTIQY